jgi:type I restriction enzyme S subunit
MTADLKPYPAYKGSGVPWLGKVPEHWGLPRLGAVLCERGETNDDGCVTEVLSVMRDRGVIPYADKGNVGNKKSDDITRYKIVRPDDIVVNCMNVIIGSVGLSRYTGCLSPVYYVLTRRSHTDDPRYLNAYFQTKPFQLSLVRIGNGILAHRMRIPMELLKCEPFPKPPSAEQTAIVRYLDYMDRRIRRYIHAKQKLIKLLEEQKQAIIHRAVTRGLDLDVRLKSSGVEWLGDVPEHWKVARLKDVAVVQTGLTLGKNYQGVPTETRPYLRVANVQHGRLDLSVVKYLDVPASEASGATLRSGDVLMTEGGDIDKLGRGCVWHDEIPGCLHQNHVFAVRCRRTALMPEFLAGLMVSPHGRTYFQLTAKQTTNLASTNSTTLRAFPVLLPPVSEQETILAEIARRTEGIDGGTARVEHEISLLREYRTRLIADVVTGKLDVREAAATLPDEAEEPEPIDEAETIVDGAEEGDGVDLDAAPEEAEV